MEQQDKTTQFGAWIYQLIVDSSKSEEEIARKVEIFAGMCKEVWEETSRKLMKR